VNDLPINKRVEMAEEKQSPNELVARTIAAGTPVVCVVSWEEDRLGRMLQSASQKLYGDDRPVWEWSTALGFTSGPGRDLKLLDPLDALSFLINEESDAICLFKDLPVHFENNLSVVRAVRDVYASYSNRKGSVVMSHPWNVVPAELSKEVYLLELPLPDTAEILELLRTMSHDHDAADIASDDFLDRMSVGMHGLSLNEARDLFRKLLSESTLDVDAALDEINLAKAQLLMKENCLEVVTKKYDIDQIGGLDKLKSWVKARSKLFTKEAQEANIKTPAGILLMGVSGCGKSLAAKTIPTVWNLPCIRLDMNKIMSGGWGSPEVAWERAIRAAENAAPVVLWIDEIENSFGFLNDSATSGNMTIFSSFLTWMQEKPPNVFVAATANRIEILPPEMIRKGRFDQLFFVDLPEIPARMDILRIHILDQGGDPEQFDLKHLAGLINGWTAAEIEEMVKAARIDAFSDGREFSYDDIIHNIYRIVPLSKTMSEQLNALRIWSHNRAIKAN
jgi:SpoVK/Ycf46/Vps4 family AAA+-type ATPase